MKPSTTKTNLIVLLVVSVITLIFGEISLRLIKGFKPMRTSNPYEVYNDTLGWLGSPGFCDSIPANRGQVFYSINSWGFRDDPPPPLDQTRGKHRVMLLGDSFVEGYNIESRDRASDMLRQMDSTLVINNCGIRGYSTDQELLTLKKFGPLIKPEVVIVFFCLNDLLNNTANYNYGLPKPYYSLRSDSTLELQNVPVPERPNRTKVILWLKNNYALGHYSFNLLNKLKSFHYWIYPGPEGILDSIIYKPDTLRLYSSSSPPRDMTRYLFKEMKAECDRQHARLLVFGTVDGYDVAAHQELAPEAMLMVLQWCRDYGITATDLCPLFHEEFLKTHNNYFAADRYHWNAAGNRLVAQAVLDQLHTFFADSSAPSEIQKVTPETWRDNVK
jgi:lysophospholipase L1-like esterase